MPISCGVPAVLLFALIVKYLKHDAFKKGLAKATQAMRRPILDHFRECRTPSGRRYGENRLATMQKKNITAVLEGKAPNAQRNWLKALRHLIAFAIAQGVPQDHDPFGHAAGPRRPDIGAVEGLDHARTCEPRHMRKETDRQRHHRQDQMG